MKITETKAIRAMIEHEEQWADEYIKRSDYHSMRRAWREVAHYEDLIALRQNHAQELRKLIGA